MKRKLNSSLNIQDTVGLRIRDRFKRIALAIAVFAVVTVLYLSLLPALAQDGSGYLYFDNSLSQYDTIECYVNGASVNMVKLSTLQAGDTRMPSDLTNVNTNTVYVTEKEVTDGTAVKFVGIDSGTVYDSVTNFRPGSAAREWGYDYQNFKWETGEFSFDSSQFDCYYAPPKLLQNTYSAEASLVDGTGNLGEFKLQQLIWAQGDTNEQGQSAKPESNNSFIQPDTATNRTFANAVFAMNGSVGAVEAVNMYSEYSQSLNGNTYEGSVAVNGDGDNGLASVEANGGKVYHATADFYDFFSDWEIAGKSLSQHTIAYGYENADMERKMLFDIDGGSVAKALYKNYNFNGMTEGSLNTSATGVKSKSIGDFTIEYYFETDSEFKLTTEKNHSGDDGGSSICINQKVNDDTYHMYLPVTGVCVPGMNYNVSVWALASRDKTGNGDVENVSPKLLLEVVNSNGSIVSDTELAAQNTNGDNKNWYELAGSFVCPELEEGQTIRLCIEANKKQYYIDDFVIDEEDSKVVIETSVNSLEREISIVKNNEDSTVGTNTQAKVNQYSDKDAYSLSGKVVSKNGGIMNVRIDYYANENTGAVAQSKELGQFQLEAGMETEISVNAFQHYPGHKAAKLVISMTDGSDFVADLQYYKEYFTLGTFSEGTERISYSYQGMLLNQAISDYYSSQCAENSGIVPLYFASNNWLTGNGRFNLYDGDGNATGFSEADVTAGNTFVKTNSSEFGTYLFPFDRQYLKNLFGFNRNSGNQYLTVPAMDTPFGRSNSRSVTGLVDLVNVTNSDGTSSSELRLKNTSVESPYFNKEFLEGDNSFNAKLGNVYEDVKFDFVFNEDTGYYEYDSTMAKYATRVTQATDAQGQTYYYMDYYNYDNTSRAGVKKADSNIYDENGSSQTIYQFFPFNSPLTNNKFSTENLMFSMNLNIPFNMYVDKELRNESMFKFSGDDDVWVYVDDKLALDIGGTHRAVGGLVDLKNGYAVTGSSYLDKTGSYVSDSFVSGTNSGINDVEKAAFALIASARILNSSGDDKVEVGIDKANSGKSISPLPFELNGTEVYAHFFDDVFIAADANTAPTYTYTIADGTITVEFTNIKKSNGDLLEDTNGLGVTSGKAVFALSEFSIDSAQDGQESNTDLSKHELSVYYMERGLNSSNFKMEFNFIQSTTREVSKEWADGIANHDNSTDSVNIQLYRTEPTVVEVDVPKTEYVKEIEEYKLDKNIMYVKVQAQRGLNAEGKYSTQSNQRFFAKDEQILVYYKKYDTDKNLYLTINGIPVSKEMYDRYQDTDTSDGNQSLYYIYLETTDSDGNRIVVDPFTDANYTNYIGEDDRGPYIKVPGGYQLWVQVNDEYLSQWESTAVPTVADVTKYNKTGYNDKYETDNETLSLSQWCLNDIQGFLIDASIYARNEETGASETIETGSQGNTATTDRTTYIDSSSGMTLGKSEDGGTEVDFVILRNKRWNKEVDVQYYTYTYDVKLVPKGHTLSMKSGVYKDQLRAVSQRITDWYGPETVFGNRECKGAYGVMDDVFMHYPTPNPIPESSNSLDKTENINSGYQPSELWSIDVSPSNAMMIEYSCHDRFTRAVSETGQQGNTFRTPTITLLRETGDQILVETGEFETIQMDVYTDAIPIGDEVTLNRENNWKHTYDTIVEGEQVDGVMKQYVYFIHEVSVNSAYGGIEAYKQVYYDANGIPIEPQQVKYNGDTLTLYPNASSVKVANIPLTDLNLAKEWGDTVDEEDKAEQIYMNVYSSTDGVNGKLVKRQTLSNDTQWKSLLEDLPLYEAVPSTDVNGNPTYTWNRITYYAAEDPVYYWRDDGGGSLNQVEFLAVYTPLEKASLALADGSSVVAYKFSEANLNSLTVKTQNMLNNPGEFSLRLLKMSEDESEYLKNAEFALYKLKGSEYVLEKTFVTDENGEINFGLIDVSENEVYGDSVTYKIVETKSPFGYELPENGAAEIVFTVTQGNEKALELTSYNYGSLVSHSTTEDMTVLKFTVKNKVKPIIMPNTGGIGTSSIYIGGITALIISFAEIIMFNKSKRKK